MIWVTNSAGSMLYLSPEWEALTSQPVAEAKGTGWIDKTHVGDREDVRKTFFDAIVAKQSCVAKFRLSFKGGHYTRVLLSGAPTFLPDDGTFVGYLGVIKTLDADGSVSHPGEPALDLQKIKEVFYEGDRSFLETLADQLLLAHTMALTAGEMVLVSVLDIALVEVGRRLARFEEGPGLPATS